jgi:L-threonylcarbamoyladenylate synthase
MEHAAELVRRGGVIGYPTETSYGLGADALNTTARERIFVMKGRRSGRRLPVVVYGLDQLATLCDPIPASVRLLAERFWPGPLTVVVPLRAPLREALGSETSVAVRVSGLAVARELPRAAGCPLTATSANESGKPPAQNADEVAEFFEAQLDLILDGRPSSGTRPSTIVDLQGVEPLLLRAGPVDFDEVQQALRGESLP